MPSHKSLSEESGASIYGEESGVQADFGASMFKSPVLTEQKPKSGLAHTSMLHATKPHVGTRLQTLTPRLSGMAALVATTAANPFAPPPVVDDGSGTADGSDGSSASGNGGSAAPSASDDASDDGDSDGYDDGGYDDGGYTDDGGGDAYSDDGTSDDTWDDGSDWSE